MKKIGTFIGLLGVGALVAMPLTAKAVVFNTDGVGGGLPTINIGGMDWLPGSAYALSGNSAFVNAANGAGSTVFTTFFHASAGQLLDGAGNAVFSPSSSGIEFTMVARFDEVVTFAFGAPINIATFSYSPSALEFLEIYYDPTPDASPLAGTGYNNGRLIMRADITAVNSTFQLTDNFTDNGVLSVNDNVAAPDGAVDVDDLDQTNGNQYPGVKTIYGTGATTLFANVIDFDSTFFVTSPGSLIFDILTTTQVLPFGSTDPSNAYALTGNGGPIGNVAGGAAPVGQGVGNGIVGAGIGLVNGHNSSTAIPGDYIPPGGLLTTGLGGPDIIFQTDASNDFSSSASGVPEPITATLGLFGLGALGLGLGRRRHA